MGTNRIRILIMVLMMLFLLAGCNSNKSNSEVADQEEQEDVQQADNEDVAEDSLITFEAQSEIDPEIITFENQELAEEFRGIFDEISNADDLFKVDALENINDGVIVVGDRSIAYMGPDTFSELNFDKMAYYVRLYSAGQESCFLIEEDSEVSKRLMELVELIKNHKD